MKGLFSAAVAYYGVMTAIYLAREAKGGPIVRSLASAATAYYAIMVVVYLNREGHAGENAGSMAFDGADTAASPP